MKRIIAYMAILLSLATGTSTAREPLRLKVMSYNLRFGELATLEEIASHIKSFAPDFVALQEIDVFTNRERAPHQQGKDFVATLARETGMFGLYGKAIDYKGGYYGVAILSKYPYIEVKKELLPNATPPTEQRVLLEGLFEVGADTVRFASTHLDISSEELRLRQAGFIDRYFKATGSRYPTLIGGDFNSDAQSSVISFLEKNWQQVSGEAFSVPAAAPTRKIDYLFAQPKGAWKVMWTQTARSCLSDHLPVVAWLEYNKNVSPN